MGGPRSPVPVVWGPQLLLRAFRVQVGWGMQPDPGRPAVSCDFTPHLLSTRQ